MGYVMSKIQKNNPFLGNLGFQINVIPLNGGHHWHSRQLNNSNISLWIKCTPCVPRNSSISNWNSIVIFGDNRAVTKFSFSEVVPFRNNLHSGLTTYHATRWLLTFHFPFNLPPTDSFGREFKPTRQNFKLTNTAVCQKLALQLFCFLFKVDKKFWMIRFSYMPRKMSNYWTPHINSNFSSC